MLKLKIDILVISIASPILIGIYKDQQLIDTFSIDGKTSDVLPIIFQDIINQYKINTITYVNGPGSFMAIKVAFIFLRTICITQNIPLFAMSGFDLNNNSPIKALGKKYFFNRQDAKIDIDFLNDDTQIDPFKLPNMLDMCKLLSSNEPNYNLPAVN